MVDIVAQRTLQKDCDKILSELEARLQPVSRKQEDLHWMTRLSNMGNEVPRILVNMLRDRITTMYPHLKLAYIQVESPIAEELGVMSYFEYIMCCVTCMCCCCWLPKLNEYSITVVFK